MVPRAIEGRAGVTLIVVKFAGVTVKAVEPLIEPEVALIVLCPVATLVACPILGAVLLMVATAGAVLLQVTEVVRLRVLPSV